MNIDKSKLTFIGSLNIPVQVWPSDDGKTASILFYMPRKEGCWHSDSMPIEDAKEAIREGIERLKIGIQLFENFLSGSNECVYYFDPKEEA